MQRSAGSVSDEVEHGGCIPQRAGEEELGIWPWRRGAGVDATA